MHVYKPPRPDVTEQFRLTRESKLSSITVSQNPAVVRRGVAGDVIDESEILAV